MLTLVSDPTTAKGMILPIVSFNALSSSSSSSESYGNILRPCNWNSCLILCLKADRSSIVNESDLAMTGTTLTTSLNFFKTCTSSCFSWCPVGAMKKRQQ